MVDLSPEALRRLQMIELELLVEVDRICKKCGIRYQIIAGTLLGAERNGGFIPWDDDADVAFLRPEYERFRQACAIHLDRSRFYFQDMRETPGYRWGYGKLRRRRTMFLRENQEHMPYEQGVFIDLFPLDAVPDGHVGRMLVNFDCFMTRKMLWARVGKIADRSAMKRTVYAVMDRIPLRCTAKHLQTMVERGQHRHSAWVRILTFPTPNNAYAYKRQWYMESKPTVFEGIVFPGMQEADDYLTFKFGSWRQLPPPNQRKTHPVSKIYLLEDEEYAEVLASLEAQRERERA